MNISFLSTFYPYRGGIAQFNASMYRAFEKNHHVNAFTFTTQYPDVLFPGTSQFVGKDDLSADNIDSKRILSTVNPLSYLSTAKKIKREKPDILIMKYWMPFFAPSLGAVSWLLKNKCKIITVLDNVIPHERRPGDIILNKFFLNQNHGFVVMSEVVKKDLLTLKPDAKYIFHPHPLYDHFGNKHKQDDAKTKLHLPADKKIILFFGFIRDYKGLDILIEAMEGMPDNYHLVIAGEVYGDFEKYEKLINEKKLDNKITRHVRYISDQEVPLFFSAADVCVLPYKSATQSGITSIAYHFDLPIIATDVGGLKESIEHDKTGIIVPSPEKNMIAKAINDYFINNKKNDYIQYISQLKKELSWDHLANAIIDFSKQL